jgi:endonuclease G
VYESRDIDRGHLVRRLDPVWGVREVALEANQDTFTFANAAPQAAGFNQGKALWAGVEDHVLDHADAHDIKVSVFTAPIFGPNDPRHLGVRVPRQFWKIAAWTSEPIKELRSAGFILDQSEQLDRIALDDRAGLREAVPDLGGFKAFQVPIEDIAKATGLPLAQLVKADRYVPPTPVDGLRGWVMPWRQLTTARQVTL